MEDLQATISSSSYLLSIGKYLENSLYIDSRNEWEAWDVGSKYPRAYRYRSFWDMMQEIYKRSITN